MRLKRLHNQQRSVVQQPNWANIMSESLDSILGKALSDSSVRSAQDALVVALHACLLSGGFVCVALGDEKFGEEATRTLPAISTPDQPVLPAEWNSSPDVYTLQYRHVKSRQLCLVKVIPLGEQLLVNALAAGSSDKVHSLTLNTSKFVKDTAATEFNSQSSFTNLLQLITTLNKEIQSKLAFDCEKCREGMVTGGRRERDQPGEDPLRVGPPRHPRGPLRDPDPLAEPGPFGIGDGDRLPFGAGGGGMIFDPLRQGGRHGGGRFPGSGPLGPLPPHHPPGARFDPVSPFGPGVYPLPGRQPRGGRWSQEPDPDHLPPPGYDDMFS